MLWRWKAQNCFPNLSYRLDTGFTQKNPNCNHCNCIPLRTDHIEEKRKGGKYTNFNREIQKS